MLSSSILAHAYSLVSEYGDVLKVLFCANQIVAALLRCVVCRIVCILRQPNCV